MYAGQIVVVSMSKAVILKCSSGYQTSFQKNAHRHKQKI